MKEIARGLRSLLAKRERVIKPYGEEMPFPDSEGKRPEASPGKTLWFGLEILLILGDIPSMEITRARLAAVLTLGFLPLAALLAVMPAFALTASHQIGEIGAQALGGAMLPVVPMHDMEGDRWILSVAPGYWTVTNISPGGDGCPNGSCGRNDGGYFPFSISGLSIAASLKREFTPHWGLSGIAAYEHQLSPVGLGSYTSGLQPNNVSGVGSPGGQFFNTNSGAAALMATYDPFTNPQGFRMPISFGPFYGMQGIGFKHDVSPTQTESANWRQSYIGVMANLSLDFLLFHDLRVMPGVLFFGGLTGQKSGYAYVVNQNGAVTNYPGAIPSGSGGFDPYVQLLWRPWNLASTISLLSGANVYALTWSHKWVGSKTKEMIAEAKEKAKKKSKAPTLTSQAFQAGAKGTGFDPYLELDPVTLGLRGSSGNSGGTDSLEPHGNGIGARLGLLYWMTSRFALGVSGGGLMQSIANSNSQPLPNRSEWFRALAEARYLFPINNSFAFSLGAGAGLANGRTDSEIILHWTGPTWELTPSVIYKNGEFGLRVMGLPSSGMMSYYNINNSSGQLSYPSATLLQAFLAYHF